MNRTKLATKQDFLSNVVNEWKPLLNEQNEQNHIKAEYTKIEKTTQHSARLFTTFFFQFAREKK